MNKPKDAKYTSLRRLKAPRAEGSARFGGAADFNFPGYAAVYVRAARAVLDAAGDSAQLDQLALPCIYLQRHALELIIKQLHDTAVSITAAKRALREQAVYEQPVGREGHVLTACAKAASKALDAEKYSFPEEIERLAQAIESFEDGDETRLRYPEGIKRNYRGQVSFAWQVEAPVIEWQNALEAIAKIVFFRHKLLKPAPPSTLLEEMGEELHDLQQKLYAADLL